jgi:hypothetical protein
MARQHVADRYGVVDQREKFDKYPGRPTSTKCSCYHSDKLSQATPNTISILNVVRILDGGRDYGRHSDRTSERSPNRKLRWRPGQRAAGGVSTSPRCEGPRHSRSVHSHRTWKNPVVLSSISRASSRVGWRAVRRCQISRVSVTRSGDHFAYGESVSPTHPLASVLTKVRGSLSPAAGALGSGPIKLLADMQSG